MLEIVNRGAKKQGFETGPSGTADSVLNGISWIKAQAREQPEMPALKSSKTATNFGNRYLSNLKSELVRSNLVTRTDLMKLYKPPPKKGEDQSKNPFLSATFFGGGDRQPSITLPTYRNKLESAYQTSQPAQRVEEGKRRAMTGQGARSVGRKM